MNRIKPQIAKIIIVLGIFCAYSVLFAEAAKREDVPVQKEAPARTLTIDRGKSQVLNFSRRVKRISVNDPKIVGVVAVTPLEILLNAKASGTTSLRACSVSLNCV